MPHDSRDILIARTWRDNSGETTMADEPHGPQYLMAAREGGYKGGLIGGLIGSVIAVIVCFVCHYLMS
jgi:hypothetical protein